ncbi:MAG: DUF3027 domain-containing protein [Nocardioidaceae bacterium]|nr:DUF3027 domain-containing protein [Nocardioidaceae bacterium]
MTTDATSAVETARAALVEQVGESVVGEHVATVSEDDSALTEYFACTQAGYPGWRWAVTVAMVPDQDRITVDEVVLLPGEEAIVAPAWVPWRERIKPGDLSPGDILPVEEDDPRLVPAYLTGDPGDENVDPAERQQQKLVADELGLGRVRVLSLEGRDQAAQRWYDGEPGPDVPLAQSAPARCGTCGFMLRLSGGLSDRFGVCANEFANDDGKVVAFQHGCGAHSEAQLRKKQLPPPLPDPVFDTMTRGDLEDF